MARLIDAEKLWLTIEFTEDGEKHKYYEQFEVDNAPTIDAEPVIRCKDCEYYNGEEKYCVNDIFAKPNGYCMYGERKDE